MKVLVDEITLEKQRKILDWLSTENYSTRHKELRKTRIENSGKWFLNSNEFTSWSDGTGHGCLLCMGIRLTLVIISLIVAAGAGKSILMWAPIQRCEC